KLSGTVEARGPVQVRDSGKLIVDAGGLFKTLTNTASIQLQQTSELRVSGAVDHSGSVLLAGNSSLSLDGAAASFRCAGDLSLETHARAELLGSAVIEIGAELHALGSSRLS